MTEIRGNILGEIVKEINKQQDCKDIYLQTEKATVFLEEIEVRFTRRVSSNGWTVRIEVSPKYETGKELRLSTTVEVKEKKGSIAVVDSVEPVISKFKDLLQDMKNIIANCKLD